MRPRKSDDGKQVSYEPSVTRQLHAVPPVGKSLPAEKSTGFPENVFQRHLPATQRTFHSTCIWRENPWLSSPNQILDKACV